MRECEIWGLVMLLKHIDDARAGVNPWIETDRRDEIVPPEGLNLYVNGIMVHARYIADKLRLQSTNDRVWHGGGAFYLISSHLTWQQLSSELAVLRQAIEADLEKHRFVQVTPTNAVFVERLKSEWEPIWTAIPDAKIDIEEATYCLALERDTACVFHAMRVAEWGLRAFCGLLGFRHVKATKKNGQVVLTPIAFSTWEAILSQLRPHAKTKSDRVKNRVRRQELQEFYNLAIEEIEGFKDAWRNHVMHTRRSYSAEDAIAALTHVQRFMRLLVSNGVAKA